ncbi:nonsense-mediated mRNA decay factor SMG9-like [Schistocerca gregaria]|uniref:nonsense-mediated mRNA decay factor SMG9-like n=1 Tax=Schistocerca gregaria TaxID=7010 RepID=UPI00211EDD12|nr:nonsense-mediated mRNA decay factor SMG9-like [Schistocerca gregaria]
MNTGGGNFRRIQISERVEEYSTNDKKKGKKSRYSSTSIPSNKTSLYRSKKSRRSANFSSYAFRQSDQVSHPSEQFTEETPEALTYKIIQKPILNHPSTLESEAPALSCTPAESSGDSMKESLEPTKQNGGDSGNHSQLKKKTSVVQCSTPQSAHKTALPNFCTIKIINEQFQFQPLLFNQIKAFLNATEAPAPGSHANIPFSTASDCLVIGVLGCQSVGKSTLMNAIYHCQREWESGALVGPFKIATHKTLLSSQHQTTGVDMAIGCFTGNSGAVSTHSSNLISSSGGERLLLLDVQPFPTATMLANLKRSEPQLISDTKTYEHMLHLSSIHLGLFLLSACHILLVVDDRTTAISNWKYLRTLEMLKWMLPDVSEIGSFPSPSVYVPKLKQNLDNSSPLERYSSMIIECRTRAMETDFHQSSNEQHSMVPEKKQFRDRRRHQTRSNSCLDDEIQSLYIEKTEDITSFVGSGFGYTEEENMASILDGFPLYNSESEYFPSIMFVFNRLSQLEMSESFTSNVRVSLENYFQNTRFAPSSINPETNSRQSSVEFCFIPSLLSYSMLNPLPKQILIHFSRRVLSMPRPQFRKSQLSLKEWLMNASKLWEFIKQSPVLSQYNEILKKIVY